MVQPRDGAARGTRRVRARLAVVRDRTARVPLRRTLLQLRRSSPLQGQVRAGVVAALPSVPDGLAAPAGACGCDRARERRVAQGSHALKRAWLVIRRGRARRKAEQSGWTRLRPSPSREECARWWDDTTGSIRRRRTDA